MEIFVKDTNSMKIYDSRYPDCFIDAIGIMGGIVFSTNKENVKGKNNITVGYGYLHWKKLFSDTCIIEISAILTNGERDVKGTIKIDIGENKYEVICDDEEFAKELSKKCYMIE